MTLKKAYLYLVSIISLVIMVIGGIMIINLALKAWVFKKADMNFYSSPCYSQAPAPAGSAPQPCSAAEQQLLDQQRRDEQTSQRQQTAAQALAMIFVAAPVWYYHWRTARREA